MGDPKWFPLTEVVAVVPKDKLKDWAPKSSQSFILDVKEEVLDNAEEVEGDSALPLVSQPVQVQGM